MNNNKKTCWPRTVVSVIGIFDLLIWGVACAPPASNLGDNSGEKDKGEAEPAEQVNLKNPDQSKLPKNAGFMVLGGIILVI